MFPGFAATDIDEQLRFYSEAIRLKPDFVIAYYNRSLARGASKVIWRGRSKIPTRRSGSDTSRPVRMQI